MWKRFKDGLKEKHNMSPETFALYSYAGGSGASTSIRHLNYYKLMCKDEETKFEMPPHTTECVCGHKISENCFMKYKESVIVLGNCCIQRYSDSEKKCRTCSVCGQRHMNRVVNKCNNCRKGVCAKCNTPIEAKYQLCYDCKYGICSKSFLESAPAPDVTTPPPKTIVCVDCKKPIDKKITFVVKGHCDLCFFKIPINTLLQA